MGLLCAAEHDITVADLMSKGLLEHQSEISKVRQHNHRFFSIVKQMDLNIYLNIALYC